MNDNEFDELLHQSLKFKVTEQELKVHTDKEGRSYMKKARIIKPVIAAAACAALILGVSKVPDMGLFDKGLKEAEVEGVTDVGGLIDSVSDSFTIHSYAKGKKKELKKNMSIASLNSYSAVWGGGEDELETYFCEAFPMVCEGENIDKVTYSINKGAFQIFHKDSDGFVVDGDRLKDGLNVGAIPPAGYDDEDEEGRIGIGYDEGYYTSFSVSPDFQYGDDISVSICDDTKVSKSTYSKLWDFVLNEENFTEDVMKAKSEGRNDVLSRIKITCTVTYKDGTTESKDIAVGSKLMTAKEAGDTDAIKKEADAIKEGEIDKEQIYDYTTYTVL